MKKYSQRISILFAALLFSSLCLSIGVPSFANTKTATQLEDLEHDDTAISSIVDSLLNQQQIELISIREELTRIGTLLAQNIPILRQETDLTANEFSDISTITQSAVATPAELDILQEQNARLVQKLSAIYTPLADTLKQISDRIKQLDIMKKNITVDNKRTKALMTDIISFQKSYRLYHGNLEKYIHPAETLLSKIQSANDAYAVGMPKIWLDYYLTNTDHVFSKKRWQQEFRKLSNISNLFSVRVINDIPQDFSTWMRIIFNTLLAGMIMTLTLYASQKASRRLPLIFHITWKKILKHSAPWLVAGTALHYSAWNNNELFQSIANIGTLCLCWGQMSLAWDIYTMQKDNTSTRSPLWVLFVPLLTSLILFYIGPFPLITALIWFGMLSIMLYYLYSKPKTSSILALYSIYGFILVLCFGILATPSGLSRISILSCMIYSAIIIGIQQVVAFMHISNIVQEYIPKNGMAAIFSSALLSIGIPLVLLFAIFSPAIWIIAYPGGEYIIENIRTLDFSIGKFSFNVWQLLSVFIAFYLTRSLTRIASRFLDTSWSKNHSATASLTTPIKTTITFSTWGLFGLYLLNVIGFNLTSITFIAGGLSVGVGLGLQSIVQNVFSGFSLIFGQNIREGDVVEVGTVVGIVQKVGMRATQVRTYDNSIVFVPNAQFLATSFINWTHNGRMVRRSIFISVAYGSDLTIVTDTTLALVKEHHKILKYPEPDIIFLNFGASSLDFELRFWITNIDEGVDILSDLRFAISQAYKEKNIEIPFPQTDIHVYKHNEDLA